MVLATFHQPSFEKIQNRPLEYQFLVFHSRQALWLALGYIQLQVISPKEGPQANMVDPLLVSKLLNILWRSVFDHSLYVERGRGSRVMGSSLPQLFKVRGKPPLGQRLLANYLKLVVGHIRALCVHCTVRPVECQGWKRKTEYKNFLTILLYLSMGMHGMCSIG